MNCLRTLKRVSKFDPRDGADSFAPTRIRRRGTFLAVLHGSRRAPAGYTLVELFVVLAIILVAATMAASDLSGLIGRYRLNGATRALAKEVEATRVQAITQNREYALVLVAADPAADDGNSANNVGRWELRARLPGTTPPTFTAVQEGLHDLHDGPGPWRGISLEPWEELAGPTGYSLPDALVFSPRGFLLNEGTDFHDGVIRIILRNKAGSGSERRVVRVSRGGNAELAALP